MRKAMTGLVAVVLSLGFLGPVGAAEADAVVPAVPEAQIASDWQAVISGQMAAFRLHDGAKALSFAGMRFREGFADPAAFLAAVDGWGYAPLLESRSESFGKYTMVAPDEVVQSVMVLGKDMVVYLALYDLQREADGWRVRGVQLTKTAGMGA